MDGRALHAAKGSSSVSSSSAASPWQATKVPQPAGKLGHRSLPAPATCREHCRETGAGRRRHYQLESN